jgi:hypothetical protein
MRRKMRLIVVRKDASPCTRYAPTIPVSRSRVKD